MQQKSVWTYYRLSASVNICAGFKTFDSNEDLCKIPRIHKHKYYILKLN